jgi:hypothetical protein
MGVSQWSSEMSTTLHLQIFTMKKKGVLQLVLQLNFWIVEDTCNSLYLYVMNVNR